MSPHRSFDTDELVMGLRTARIGLWAVDLTTHEVRWTSEMEELFGFETGSFPGTLDAVMDVVHPDDRARVLEEVRRHIRDRSVEFAVECRIRLASGETHWVSSRGRVLQSDGVPTKMMGAAMDVSARRKAEQEAARTAELFRLYSKLASDYVYEYDLRADYPTIIAGSFERVTGHTPESFQASGGWQQIIHPDDRADTFTEMMAAGDNPFVVEYRIVRPDGSVRWLRDCGCAEADPETGALFRYVGGVQDITELKELENRLLQAQRMEALAELAGRVAHDFNNLLTIVLGALGLVEKRVGELGGETRAYFEAAHEALDRATELTRSLLTFGRHGLSSAEVVDLRAELESVRPLLESAVGEGVSLSIHVAPEVEGPVPVLVDRGELRLALMNLVINARDAMEGKGPVQIVLDAREVRRECPERPADLPPGPAAALAVIDRGPGIPPELLARIFEPYFTTKGPGRGTGLGLAIAYGVAHKHGGTISVKSELGVGTGFTLWFPLSEAPLATRAEPRPRASLGGRDQLLLVEDDPGVRVMVAEMLESHGYFVRALGSAEEALALSTEALDEIDLLVSDVRLGGMDGIAVAGQLRERRARLPVLLISGYTDATRHDEIRENGYRFVPKPFTPTALATAIREVLDEAALA